MKQPKRQKLEAAGWQVGSATDFLGLSKEEESLIEMKLALARKLKARRQSGKLTQFDMAKRLGSSQSRIAKMEVADKSVSLDLLVRSLLSLGATRQDVAGALGARIAKQRLTRSTPKKHTVAS
jgi:DNA-binding XRE family transcriptional regulator